MLIILDDDYPQKPLAISLPKDYLRSVKESTQTSKEFKDNEFINLLPIPLKDLKANVLRSLHGISLIKTEEDIIATSIGEIIVYLWCITELRKRLSQKVKIEFKW